MYSPRRLQALCLAACSVFTVSTLAVGAEPNAALSAAQCQIISLDNSVKAGDKVTLKLATPAETACHIEVQDASLTDALKLLPQVSDKHGRAVWTWTVPKDYRAQVMPVILTMRFQNHDEKLVTFIKVAGHGKIERPSLSVGELPGKVQAGDSLAVNIKTEPNTRCEIKVQGAAASELPALIGQTADSKGCARWTFHVPKHYRADRLPIIITTATDSGESKFVTAVEVRKLTASK